MAEAPAATPRLVLDTSALLTYFYITLREQGEEVARERLALLQQLPLIRVESDPGTALAAGHLKAAYPLSLADCWVAALAEQYGALLVHKDPEFESLRDRIETLALPYKGEAE